MRKVALINALEPGLRALPKQALAAKTGEFRGRLASGESLDALLPEAFAVVREAATRVLGMRHYDVQLVCYSFFDCPPRMPAACAMLCHHVSCQYPLQLTDIGTVLMRRKAKE